MTTSADVGAATPTPGWLGTPACRDLALGITAAFAARAIAAHVDPLASTLERRLNLVLLAVMALALVVTAAYASTGGTRLSRPLVDLGRVAPWARPGGTITTVLAWLTIGVAALAIAGLFDSQRSLVDHVSSVGTTVFIGLGVRVQVAAAPSTPSPGRTRLLRAAVAAVVVAVAATAVAAPAVLRRDDETARCKENDVIHQQAQDALATLRGEELRRRIEELARELNECGG